MSHGMKDFGTRRLLTFTSIHIAAAHFLHGFRREIDSCMDRTIIVPSLRTRVVLQLLKDLKTVFGGGGMETVIADMFRRGGRRLLCVLLSSALFSAPLPGQEGLSTLRGTVTDASGAVVPRVEVAAREVLTNITARTVTSDAQGNYEMPGL